MRLDAHVDVFRHQHDLAIRAVVLQRAHDAENLVVGLAFRQTFDRLDVGQRGLEVQAAGRLAAAQARRAKCRPTYCRRWRPAHPACGSPDARYARLPTCLSCGCRVLPTSSSADRRRVPRSGTGSSDRASARSCRARRACRSRFPAGRADGVSCCAARLRGSGRRGAAAACDAGFALGARGRGRLRPRSSTCAAGAAPAAARRRSASSCATRAACGAALLGGRGLGGRPTSLASGATCSRHWRRAPCGVATLRGRNRPTLRLSPSPACFFAAERAGRGFGLVFVRRQEIAELAGGGRQRHGFPRNNRVTYRAPPVAFCRLP